MHTRITTIKDLKEIIKNLPDDAAIGKFVNGHFLPVFTHNYTPETLPGWTDIEKVTAQWVENLKPTSILLID